jgi:alpha-glucosidase
LLCRFVEMMALHPRAVMNSWKPQVASDWTAATHPWTHPEVFEQVKQALHLRTTFLPLMYTLAHRAHRDGEPIIRPLFHDFPDDPACFAEHDAMMLGPDVLFSPVVKEGATTKRQYLPSGPAGWIDFHTGALHPAGAVAQVDAPLGRPPIFVRVGAALALAATTPVIKPHDAPARRLYLAVAGDSGAGQGHHTEDDGVSFAYRAGGLLDLALALNWNRDAITVTCARQGDWPLPVAADWRVDAPLAAGRPVRIVAA